MSVLYESWHFNTTTRLQVLASKKLQDGWSLLVLGRQSLYATVATTPAIFLDHLFSYMSCSFTLPPLDFVLRHYIPSIHDTALQSADSTPTKNHQQQN
jgi:hypothetical protein